MPRYPPSAAASGKDPSPPMRRSARSASHLGLAIAAAAVVAAAASPRGAADPPEPSPMQQRRDAAFEQRRKECLPEPIPESTIREWASRLGFDAEGLALLDAIVANHRDAVERADRDAAAAVRRRFDAAFRYDDAARRLEAIHTPEHLQLLDDRDRLFDRLERADAALFREFEALAAPERRGEIVSMRFERAREVHLREDRLPGASLDLVRLAAEIPLATAEHPGAAEALDRYRREQAAALQARSAGARGLERERAELLLALGPAWRLVLDEAEREEAESRLLALDIAEAELDRPLRQLHRDTLLLLRRQLPAESGRRLQEAYQQATYPELFRDDRRVSEILAEGGLASAIGEESRRAAEASIDGGLREVQRSAFLLMDLADALASVETLPDPVARAEAAMLLEIRTLEIQQARRDRLGAALRSVRSVLQPAESAADEAVAEALASHESLRRAWQYRLAVLTDRVRELRQAASTRE
jgi:hypothetical protein